MDSDLRHSMLRYYDERASEYEEAYVLGTGTASIQAPETAPQGGRSSGCGDERNTATAKEKK